MRTHQQYSPQHSPRQIGQTQMTRRVLQRCIQRIVLLCLIIAVLWSSSLQPFPAFAQGAAKTYTGLDILFLVDQSGSMGGAAYGGPTRAATDPLGLRFEAVQYALSTLGEYRISVIPKARVNMAVVNFGDTAATTLDWTSVADDGKAQSWDTIKTALLDQLSASAFRQKFTPANLNNTNFLAAFREAQSLFERVPADSSGKHLRVIVMLTDGQPCVSTGADAFACADKDQQTAFMASVLKYTGEHFPAPQYLMYVLALDASGAIWETRQKDWEQVVQESARANRVQTSEDIGVQFLNILIDVVDELNGTKRAGNGSDRGGSERPYPRELRKTSTEYIPPYHSQARLSLFKADKQPGTIVITRPDGISLESTDPQLKIENANNAIETWTILNPQPGNWTFKVSEKAGLRVFLELIPIKITAQIPPGNYPQMSTVPFTVTLLDDAGKPLQLYPAPDDLKVTATIQRPDQTQEKVTLKLTGASDFSGEVSADVSGVYTIDIEAVIAPPSSEIYSILSQSNVGQFTVTGIQLKSNTQLAPEYFVGNRIPISVTVSDVSGKPVNLPDLVVTARLHNDQSQNEIGLSSVNGSDYQGEITLENAGNFTLTVLGQLKAADGSLKRSALIDIGAINVIAGKLVNLVNTDAAQSLNISQYATDGIPPFNPVPLTFVFETREDGATQSVEAAADTTPLTDLWRLSFNPGNNDKKGANTKIAYTRLAPGRYQVTLTPLDEGTYSILLEGVGPLVRPYSFNPKQNNMVLNLTISRHPLIYVWLGGSILLTIALVVGSVRAVVQSRRRRQHPAKGELSIARLEGFGYDGTVIWTRKLTPYNSNTIRLSSRQLPSKVPASEILIECTDEQMSAQKQIYVTVKQGKKKLINRELMMSGSRVILVSPDDTSIGTSDRVMYQLIKDGDSADMMF